MLWSRVTDTNILADDVMKRFHELLEGMMHNSVDKRLIMVQAVVLLEKINAE